MKSLQAVMIHLKMFPKGTHQTLFQELDEYLLNSHTSHQISQKLLHHVYTAIK